MFVHKKIKIILLGATFSTSNMGVSALTAGTIKSIIHQFPEAEIYLLDYGRERLTYNVQINDRIIPVQLINMRFSKKFYLKNNIAVLILLSLFLKLLPIQRFKGKIISKNFYLNYIAEADIVASIAGGDSFSDLYGIGRFFYVSLPQLLVLFMGKKLVFLPQTLGPFRGRIAKAIARYIMNHARAIYSRDYIGMEKAKDLLRLDGSSGKLRFCYDVGFVLDPVRPLRMDIDGLEKMNGESSVIGLNISGLLFMGGVHAE